MTVIITFKTPHQPVLLTVVLRTACRGGISESRSEAVASNRWGGPKQGGSQMETKEGRPKGGPKTRREQSHQSLRRQVV